MNHFDLILQNLMINQTLDSVAKLQIALITADAYLSALPKETPFQNIEQRWFLHLGSLFFSVHAIVKC